jgi:hypothetical protein
MKTITIVLIAGCLGVVHAQQEQKLDSRVISATVFKDRAMITREAEQTFAKGEHTVIFSNLTSDLQDESVRLEAGGPGMIKILDVKVERRFTTRIQAEKTRALQQQIDGLKSQLQVIADKMAVLESKKSFIESLKAESVKISNQTMLLNAASPKNWGEMLRFVDTNLNEIYTGLRAQEEKKRETEEQISAVQKSLNQLQAVKSQDYKEIIVKIDNSEAGKIKLNPSYLVRNASWYPAYDLRVSSQAKQIELSYMGVMVQSTGEDWNEVKLILSTADPVSVKSLPQLDQWFVDIRPLPVARGEYANAEMSNSEFQMTYDQNWGLPPGQGAVTGYVTDKESGEPLPNANVILSGTILGAATDMNGKFLITNIPHGLYSLQVSYIGYETMNVNVDVRAKNILSMVVSISPGSLESEQNLEVRAERAKIEKDMATSTVRTREPAAPKKPKYADIYAKELSTVFELPSKNSIPSDNSPHKVTIALDDLPVEFEYNTIPKILPKVYLKGKVVNNKTYPLLEGEINVFVDNDFVNRTYLNTVVPTDTLELSLGIDESIRAERVLINKFTESKGMWGGKKKITYEYELRVTNNRSSEEIVWLYDQLPIPMNENITVELIDPQRKKEELGNEQRLEWQLNLKPGEKKIIPFKYLVEFPRDQAVYGLE